MGLYPHFRLHRSLLFIAIDKKEVNSVGVPY